jgi:Legionella pneumophila major outer membrane protein precursor
MKLYAWLLGAVLLGYTQMMWAQGCGECASCNSCDSCNMRYSVYADYLYWKPFRTGLGNIVQEGSSETIDFYLNPEYASAYRFGGRVYGNCWDLGVAYTHYESSAHRQVFIGLSGPFHQKYQVEFQNVDVELGYLFCFCGGNSFMRPFAGGKFTWVDERYSTTQAQSGSIVHIRTDDKGYGLYVGGEGKLQLFSYCNVPVGIRVRGSFGLLNGWLRFAENTSITEDPHLVTFYDVFAGIDLCYCELSCFDFNLQVGYELQSYLRSDILLLENDNMTIDDFGIGGLVIRFGLFF